MPTTIFIEHPPNGLAAQCAQQDEPISVIPKEFSSSEDGEDFIARLESFSRLYAQAFEPPAIPPEAVQTLLAITKASGETTVYVNEMMIVAKAKIQRLDSEVAPGGVAYMDDIADIAEVELRTLDDEAIEIPPDCGITLILSYRWRKCLFFDFSVFPPNAIPRTDNLPRLFGSFLARIMFQEMYSITEAKWDRLTEWGWFPFIGLTHEDRKALINWADSETKPTRFLEEVAQRFLVKLDARIASWEQYDLLRDCPIRGTDGGRAT